MANPHTFLQTQGLKVQSGFHLDRSNEDTPKELSTESSAKITPVLENGYLEEFVDKQKSFSGEYASREISTSENSGNASTQGQPTLDERSTYFGTRGQSAAHVEKTKENAPEAPNSTSSSPAEAPYLEGYGRRRLSSQDPTIPEHNSEATVESKTETSSLAPPKKPSLEENLSPWTATREEQSTSLNPFDVDEDLVPQPSAAVISGEPSGDLREVKDGFIGQGIFSDEENVGFGAVNRKESVEPETVEDLKLPGVPQPQQQRETFDEYSYNYGDHGQCTVLSLLHVCIFLHKRNH